MQTNGLGENIYTNPILSSSRNFGDFEEYMTTVNIQ